jgi:hypothetical protein
MVLILKQSALEVAKYMILSVISLIRKKINLRHIMLEIKSKFREREFNLFPRGLEHRCSKSCRSLKTPTRKSSDPSENKRGKLTPEPLISNFDISLNLEHRCSKLS